MSKLKKVANEGNAHINAYVYSVVEIKAKEACKELKIESEFDKGIVDLIVENLYYEYTITESMSFEQVNGYIDSTIEEWKKETKENYM